MVARPDDPDQEFDQALGHRGEAAKELNGEAIRAMRISLAMKDPYTAGHQHRVSHLAGAIAREMGIPATEVEAVTIAAVIHDIGKNQVPVKILNRPGPLNDFELSIIRSHPLSGHDMLLELDFPERVAEIVLQHHERLDGSGYPYGIKEPEILPEARIVAVADVFEAMTSERPYRPARTTEHALAHLSENSGLLYDKKTVDTCVWLCNVKHFSFE